MSDLQPRYHDRHHDDGGKEMLTVREWEQIRRAFYIEGKKINEIARETGRAWRTVKKMVESEERLLRFDFG